MNGLVYGRRVNSYEQELVNQEVEGLFQDLAVTQTFQVGQKVVLKPNLLAKRKPELAVTTHPAVVRAVIRACKRRGIRPQDITIADSAGGVYHSKQTEALYRGCGLTSIAEAEGVELYTACETVTLPCLGERVTEFTLLQPLTEADVILNLPKMKSHMMTGLTAGCKNMFGAVPGLQKSQWHTKFPQRLDFGHMLLDLLTLLPPALTLLDGILAMEGDGPGGGTPRLTGLLLASEDTLNLDLAVAQIMGLDPQVVPFLEAGRLRGLCGAQFDSACGRGDLSLFDPIPDWVLPKSYQNGGEGSVSFYHQLPRFLQPLGHVVEDGLAPRPVIVKEKCIGCKQCLEICGKEAIKMKGEKAKILQRPCIRCFCCHEVCPVKAIGVKRVGFLQR